MTKSDQKTVRAAGTVLFRGRGRSTEVLLVHRGYRNDWSLPKGKLDPGELACVAAVRETLEETGFKAVISQKLEPLHYVSLGLPKSVTYWIGTVQDDAIHAGDRDTPLHWQPNDEVDELRWVRAHRVEGLLTYSQDVGVVAQALERRRNTSPLIVLRHAKAEKRAAFSERFDGRPPHDHERPLTDEGDAYTHMVARAMAAYGITTAYSSPAKRCVDTVSPLVVAPHQLHREPALSEFGFEEDPQRTEERTRELMGVAQPLVISSHRPVIPTILRTIADNSHSLLPPARLKPGQFVVFHRPIKQSGQLSSQRAFTVEHSADALV